MSTVLTREVQKEQTVLQKNAKKREYGIDLLRIVSMFFVVVLHMFGNGGILTAAKPMSTGYCAAWFIGVATQCAVNCYAMISGYVGLKAKFKYSSIIMLWLQVAFYTIGITALVWHKNPSLVGGMEIKSAIFPMYFKQYWYFSAYFCVFFFMPVLNLAVEKLKKRQLEAILVTFVLVFSVLPTVFEREPFHLISGYSVLWLGLLYLLGAYFKKYEVLKKKSALVWFLIYILSTTVAWGAKMLIEKYGISLFSGSVNSELPIKYISPAILLSAIALLGIFSQVKPGRIFSKIIKAVSPLTFGIYLIHVHPYVWMALENSLLSFAEEPVYKMIFGGLGAAAAVFFVCLAIEFIRTVLFNLLHIRQLLIFIEKKFIGDLWEEK